MRACAQAEGVVVEVYRNAETGGLKCADVCFPGNRNPALDIHGEELEVLR